MSASVTVTSASPAVVTQTAHPYPTGSGVRFGFTTGGSLPSGIAADTTYFTRWASSSTYKLSSVNTASVVTADATTDAVYWPGHPFIANDAMFFGTNGTIPGGLTASNNNVAVPTYFYALTIVDADHFTVSATPGGALIDITSSGAGRHFANKHLPVNTSSTGSNVTVMGYDPSFQVAAPAPRLCAGAVNIANAILPAPITMTNISLGTEIYVVAAAGGNVPQGTPIFTPTAVTTGTFTGFTKYRGPFTCLLANASGGPVYTPYIFTDVLTDVGYSRRIEQQLDA